MGKEIEINKKIDSKDSLLQYLQDSAELIFSGKIDLTYYHSDLIPDCYARVESYNDSLMFLTVKKTVSEGQVTEREEVTIQIQGNLDSLLDLIRLFGFYETNKKSKKRQLFLLQQTKVSIDEWDDEELGIRLEIEGDDMESILSVQNLLCRFT